MTPAAAQAVIRTVHGRGYQFVAPLRPDQPGPAPAVMAAAAVPAVSVVPRTHYARSDGRSIAYQVVGDGPEDLLFGIHQLKGVPETWPLYAAS